MSTPYRPSLEAIAAEAGVTTDAARIVATATLRSLHRTAMTDTRGLTAAVLESYYCLGAEACYHLTGLLEEQRLSVDPDLPWSETTRRFAPHLRVYRAIVDKWLDPQAEA